MQQQLIQNLQQYDAQIQQLEADIVKTERDLNQKKIGLDQTRGAYAGLWNLATQLGLVNEQGQIVIPEAPEMEDADTMLAKFANSNPQPPMPEAVDAQMVETTEA